MRFSIFLLAVYVIVWDAATGSARAGDDAPQKEPPLDGRDGRELLLRNFQPRPMLKVERHEVKRARFPVVDVHTHFRYRLRHSPEPLDAFVALMDRNHIAVCVSLDGKLGADLEEHKKYLWTKYRDRFVIFANLDWRGSGDENDPDP